MLEPLFSTEEEIIQSFGFTVLHQAIVGIASPAVFDLPAVTDPLLDSTDTLGWTPLHWAARYRNAEALQRLILLGCDIHALTKNGETALHIAADSGSVACAQLLLAAGASVSATTAPTPLRTPLHQAAMSKQPSIPLLRLLIQHGAQVDTRDTGGRTPFHLAQENPEAVRLFLSLGTNANNNVNANANVNVSVNVDVDVNDLDDDGNTPLMNAVRLSAAEPVSLLLGEPRTDPSVVNGFGQNILHLAALGANLATLTILKDADLGGSGVDPDAVTHNGMTAEELFFSEVRWVLTMEEEERRKECDVWKALMEKVRRDFQSSYLSSTSV